ncbi:MAG: rod shape-determining protein RodA [Bacteroides sp.]|nr:rod shape-determining protein RodA [Bacteroides sp.]MCM1413127.1 rod shape-determining protein RodA [Bacteroides sp.]MCM1472131.1 rod shape-determining protein RodA [Bacteroides sp.]
MASRNTDQSILRHIDWLTVILYLIMIMAGVYSIYAASYDFDNASIFDTNEFSGKQIRWIGLAMALAVVLLLFDARVYETYAYPTYGLILLIMLVTIFVAPDIKGSRSWLVFGPIRFQPAEFGKFATALALAKLFSGYGFKLSTRQSYFKALAIIFVPILLILAQRETGSALAYLALFFVLYREGMSGLILLAAFCAVVFFVLAVKFTDTLFMGIPMGEAMVFMLIMLVMVCMLIFYCKKFDMGRNVLLWFAGTGLLCWILVLCGIHVPGMVYFLGTILIAALYCVLMALRVKARKLLITTGAAVVSIAFLFSVNYAFNNVLQPHQQKRIRVTLGIEDDPLGAGYNVNQAKIAIGSGGFAGKGHLNGTQTKLKYVPEQHTDFIFCTIGEEQGFVGASLVLLAFLVLIFRVIHIAERQPSTFGRVYGYCVASYLIFHLAINTGMVIGLCPVIGIPLPFFSYGGSSLWSFTILLFILLRIDAARRYHPSFL